MSAHVAFLRAINVGGRSIVKMTDLQRAFERAGARDVRTVIASGNVLFDATARAVPGIVAAVQQALQQTTGRTPAVMVRTGAELRRIDSDNPFASRPLAADVKRYVAFLARAPRPAPPLPVVSRKEAMEVIAVVGREAFVISRRKDSGLYGFPNLTIEEQLGVAATSRNWNTVQQILRLLGTS